MSLRVSLGLSITALNRVLLSVPALIRNLITQDGQIVLTQNGNYIQIALPEPKSIAIHSIITQNSLTIITQDNNAIDAHTIVDSF